MYVRVTARPAFTGKSEGTRGRRAQDTTGECCFKGTSLQETAIGRRPILPATRWRSTRESQVLKGGKQIDSKETNERNTLSDPQDTTMLDRSRRRWLRLEIGTGGKTFIDAVPLDRLAGSHQTLTNQRFGGLLGLINACWPAKQNLITFSSLMINEHFFLIIGLLACWTNFAASMHLLISMLEEDLH
jgi:hypothetical protein